MLAVGSQVLASRLRIPALIILLPASFIAGALTSDVNPERLLGAAFQPLVSLAVAVILYDAGLELELAKLRGHARRVVIWLISWGVAITWASAALLLGMSTGAALMTSAILVVSGPTVVAPLLRFIRPTERLRRGARLGEIADRPGRRHPRGGRIRGRGGRRPRGPRLPVGGV
jgi:NhaP-type Na+/H+ or K+/H+ antiporter